MAWRILFGVGRLLNCTCTCVPPRKSTPSGTGLPMLAQCMPMEMMPATLKINEKPRKYHFFPSQSTFTLRNNSTDSLRFLGRSKPPAGSSVLSYSCAGQALASREQFLPEI